MDMSICLSSIYTSSGQDEEGKDFRYYFDFEHLKESASVLDQTQFWVDWNKWQQKDGLALFLVEDFKITPMKLSGVEDTLVMKKFGLVEPDNYWYRVCEGEAESVIQRPWHMIWKSRRFSTHFLDEDKDHWDENSEWYSETMKLNSGVPVEFDGYMRASVDTEVFLRGKR